MLTSLTQFNAKFKKKNIDKQTDRHGNGQRCSDVTYYISVALQYGVIIILIFVLELVALGGWFQFKQDVSTNVPSIQCTTRGTMAKF